MDVEREVGALKGQGDLLESNMNSRHHLDFGRRPDKCFGTV